MAHGVSATSIYQFGLLPYGTLPRACYRHEACHSVYHRQTVDKTVCVSCERCTFDDGLCELRSPRGITLVAFTCSDSKTLARVTSAPLRSVSDFPRFEFCDINPQCNGKLRRATKISSFLLAPVRYRGPRGRGERSSGNGLTPPYRSLEVR